MQVFFKAKAKARIFEAKAIKIRCQGASVVSADIIISGNSIHLQFWVQKTIFLNHSDIYYLLILGYDL